MGIRQLRAYITISQVQITTMTEDGTLQAVAIIKNTGQTPAYELSAWYNIGLRACPLKDEHFDKPVALIDKESVTSLGAGAKITIDMHMGQAEVPSFDVRSYVDAGVIAVVVYGEVTYSDTFGHIRRTVFRTYNTGGVKFPRLRKYKNGNTAD